MTYSGFRAALAVKTCIFFVVLPAGNLSAEVAASQNFESWPTTGSWGMSADQGWTLSDGQVKPSRGGFGNPIDFRCGWLYDIDQSTNSWIVTPLLINGAGNLSFWVRRNNGSTATNTWAVQHSTDSTNWTTAQVFEDTQNDWHEMSLDLDIIDPVYVRIIKTGDNGANQYLGIDDISIATPAGLKFFGLTTDPAIPTSNDTINIQVQVETGANASNVSIQAHYRPESSSPYSAISMVHTGGFGYETTIPIPAGFTGRIQYYVEGSYEGPGSSPVFVPDGGSNAPALFGVFDANKLGIAAGDVWRYFDGPAEPGPDWNKLTFNDSAWSNGPALLGYGDVDIVTTISFGPDPNDKYITSYYRRMFTLADVAV